MKRHSILIVSILFVLFTSCGKQGKVDDIRIVPEPTFVLQKEGTFLLSGKTRLYFENVGQNSDIAKHVAQSFRKMHIRPIIVGEPKKNCLTITLNRQPNPEIGEEGYQLDIRTDGITIAANSEAGLFYGFQSLRQLLPSDATSKRYRSIELPECTLLDYPQYSWRGLTVDECHHFQNVSDVKRIIDLMAAYKMNRLVLQISNGQVWRISMDDLPQSAGNEVWSSEQIRELKEYARQMHVTLIPSIELENIADSLPGTAEPNILLENICNETRQLFECNYLHIGSIENLHANTVRYLDQQLSILNCRLMAWMPARTEELPTSLLLMPRHNSAEVLTALQRGCEMVMCQEEFCDLHNDPCQAQYVSHPTGIRLQLSKVYRYNPLPSGLSSQEQRNILGSQALLLTQNIQSQSRMEYTLLPRLCAFAECLWVSPDNKSWARFRHHVERQKEWLSRRGYVCCAGSFQPTLIKSPLANGQVQVMIEPEVFGTNLFYTTDGTEPTLESPLYSGVLTLSKSTLLRVRAYYWGKFREGTYDFVIQ